MVRGTAGYETYSSHFIESSQALSFHTVCRDFLQFLPDQSAHILDAGSGAGQNAMALAEMGHAVVAVEPMLAFLIAARDRYADAPIVWHHDSLPELTCLGASLAQFDFILADGVWHHLDEVERALTMQRFASLLKIGGRCAISLRNGPPGMGSLCVTYRYRANGRTGRKIWADLFNATKGSAQYFQFQTKCQLVACGV